MDLLALSGISTAQWLSSSKPLWFLSCTINWDYSILINQQESWLSQLYYHQSAFMTINQQAFGFLSYIIIRDMLHDYQSKILMGLSVMISSNVLYSTKISSSINTTLSGAHIQSCNQWLRLLVKIHVSIFINISLSSTWNKKEYTIIFLFKIIVQLGLPFPIDSSFNQESHWTT